MKRGSKSLIRNSSSASSKDGSPISNWNSHRNSWVTIQATTTILCAASKVRVISYLQLWDFSACLKTIWKERVTSRPGRKKDWLPRRQLKRKLPQVRPTRKRVRLSRDWSNKRDWTKRQMQTSSRLILISRFSNNALRDSLSAMVKWDRMLGERCSKI